MIEMHVHIIWPHGMQNVKSSKCTRNIELTLLAVELKLFNAILLNAHILYRNGNDDYFIVEKW